MQAHILYLSRIEIPSLVGNFELKSYPKSWEVWPPIFVFDQSPHPIPCPPPPHPLPLGHNIDSCIYGLFLKLRKSTFQEKKIYGAPMKPSELFCFKDTVNFAA